MHPTPLLLLLVLLNFLFSRGKKKEGRKGGGKRGGKKEGGKEGGCEWMDGVIYIYMDGWVGGGLVSGMLSVGARERECVCLSVCVCISTSVVFLFVYLFFFPV